MLKIFVSDVIFGIFVIDPSSRSGRRCRSSGSVGYLLGERLGKLQRLGEKESGLMAVTIVSPGLKNYYYYSYTAEDGERLSFFAKQPED
jgi:hypothetical protein